MWTVNLRITLCIAVCNALNANLKQSRNHNIIMGSPKIEDYLLFKMDIFKVGIPMTRRKSVVEYPEPGIARYYVIMAIMVTDTMLNHTGGYATIAAGGVGQRFVKIKLSSKKESSFAFSIKIYGRHIAR